MIRTFRVLALVSLAAVAAACSTDSDSAGNSADDLTGRTFVSTNVTGTQIPGDGPLVVAFPEDGRISATAGCNRFVGGVDLSEGRVKAPDLASTGTMTRAACADPELADIETHVLNVLAGETTYIVQGSSMTLTAPNGTDGLEFTAR
ncbi:MULTISPECIES: META domain-containing protein [Rhodococcus]|uniref:META domain-containing protein n=1 Tax=Rhodococcus TaxID=1827 RepID=UPI001E65A75A|nr:META domain-containing protein [Rhodococcus pyridinivorans]MCD2116955.1 META domain-containing protein [Rhodococcus pyridinivorans]MCZ4626203.1 META domain-containing protein [Rhodococcus pyridinivorans]MCZ4647031.1 META domain-containing protein [Rhodococcus pyridinivorans]MDJ0481287.1 META domain-containing protein [Rhodococcus pyridinivorans]MDV7253261.1 META domain-containing protein [Rhodococcus pyridinivorans]